MKYLTYWFDWPRRLIRSNYRRFLKLSRNQRTWSNISLIKARICRPIFLNFKSNLSCEAFRQGFAPISTYYFWHFFGVFHLSQEQELIVSEHSVVLICDQQNSLVNLYNKNIIGMLMINEYYKTCTSNNCVLLSDPMLQSLHIPICSMIFV